ncbi:NAD(P)/FAD-dependent oxidoreductase [Histidinibacterium aquaticum]|uniref:FAD-binding oxidoreductase n=1 Tax=Histidinibacterium aquaticum TaxID=2613962 RepID=A0A5J5GQX2_9RHOB|nr:FAD-dependent oxidoreductase [Histidinibacterium aquaticum]KAA9010475.1 FAD-binding oxidoreductase [Histidinibacterium aquaticum]
MPPTLSTPESHPDVVVIGGAMIGASIAWWLTRDPEFTGTVTVVERDPTYATASTTHTNSCLRQQFGTEINIRLSQFTAAFLRDFRGWAGPEAPEIALQEFGYLYLATSEAAAENLRAAHALQASLGAGTRLMTPAEIAEAFPFYETSDLVLGSHGTRDEGYFDGHAIFETFRKQSKAQGARWIEDTVTGIQIDGDRVTGVTLASGETLSPGMVVNATGPRAAITARMAGLDLPVEPRKRYTFVFDAAEPLDRPLPLTIDPSGVHVRSDGRYYMTGCPPDEDIAVEPDDFIEDHAIFEEKIWPALAARIPAFERIKPMQGWVGHYAYNTLDQNAILGPHPEMPNFLMANGFSGHGLQQAPGVGRGLAELIVHGGYRSLDLSPLSVERVLENRPLLERAVI